MKLLPKFPAITILIFLMMVTSLTSSSLSVPIDDNDPEDSSDVVGDPNYQEAGGEDYDDEPAAGTGALSLPLRRFLASKKTCDKYPRICRNSGSAGPDCCKKKCVNLRTDRTNCGSCGHKCKFNQSCCRGRCTNLSTDRRNCGSCGKICSSGKTCSSGLCNYA